MHDTVLEATLAAVPEDVEVVELHGPTDVRPIVATDEASTTSGEGADVQNDETTMDGDALRKTAVAWCEKRNQVLGGEGAWAELARLIDESPSVVSGWRNKSFGERAMTKVERKLRKLFAEPDDGGGDDDDATIMYGLGDRGDDDEYADGEGEPRETPADTTDVNSLREKAEAWCEKYRVDAGKSGWAALSQRIGEAQPSISNWKLQKGSLALNRRIDQKLRAFFGVDEDEDEGEEELVEAEVEVVDEMKVEGVDGVEAMHFLAGESNPADVEGLRIKAKAWCEQQGRGGWTQLANRIGETQVMMSNWKLRKRMAEATMEMIEQKLRAFFAIELIDRADVGEEDEKECEDAPRPSSRGTLGCDLPDFIPTPCIVKLTEPALLKHAFMGIAPADVEVEADVLQATVLEEVEGECEQSDTQDPVDLREKVEAWCERHSVVVGKGGARMGGWRKLAGLIDEPHWNVSAWKTQNLKKCSRATRDRVEQKLRDFFVNADPMDLAAGEAGNEAEGAEGVEEEQVEEEEEVIMDDDDDEDGIEEEPEAWQPDADLSSDEEAPPQPAETETRKPAAPVSAAALAAAATFGSAAAAAAVLSFDSGEQTASGPCAAPLAPLAVASSTPAPAQLTVAVSDEPPERKRLLEAARNSRALDAPWSRMSAEAPPEPPVVPLLLGARVKVRRKPGKIKALHADGRCCIRYDNAEEEDGVPPQHVRLLTPREAEKADAKLKPRRKVVRFAEPGADAADEATPVAKSSVAPKAPAVQQAEAQAAAGGLVLQRSDRNKTGFVGVTHDARSQESNPYHASLYEGGVTTSLGYFKTAEEAALHIARMKAKLANALVALVADAADAPADAPADANDSAVPTTHHRRPRGAAPKSYSWDTTRGAWIDSDGVERPLAVVVVEEDGVEGNQDESNDGKDGKDDEVPVSSHLRRPRVTIQGEEQVEVEWTVPEDFQCLSVPKGFAVSEKPSEVMLMPGSDEAKALVGRRILFHWDGLGWCPGVIEQANGDRRRTLDGDVVNFLVNYELDGDTSSHVLGAEKYLPNGPPNSWVLLEVIHRQDAEMQRVHPQPAPLAVDVDTEAAQNDDAAVTPMTAADDTAIETQASPSSPTPQQEGQSVTTAAAPATVAQDDTAPAAELLPLATLFSHFEEGFRRAGDSDTSAKVAALRVKYHQSVHNGAGEPSHQGLPYANALHDLQDIVSLRPLLAAAHAIVSGKLQPVSLMLPEAAPAPAPMPELEPAPAPEPEPDRAPAAAPALEPAPAQAPEAAPMARVTARPVLKVTAKPVPRVMAVVAAKQGRGSVREAPSARNKRSRWKEATEVSSSWARCDRCSKWRRLSAEPGEGRWECSMAPHDVAAGCEAPEEEMEEGERWEGAPTPAEGGGSNTKAKTDALQRSIVPVAPTDGSLPSGWTVELKTQETGAQAGKRRKVYISPCGKQFQSLVQAQRFLLGDATGTHERQSRKQQKTARKAKKAAKAATAAGGSIDDVASDDDDDDTTPWAQCERCAKWRSLPPGTVVGDGAWVCAMNPRASHASCEVAEEELGDDELEEEDVDAEAAMHAANEADDAQRAAEEVAKAKALELEEARAAEKKAAEIVAEATAAEEAAAAAVTLTRAEAEEEAAAAGAEMEAARQAAEAEREAARVADEAWRAAWQPPQGPRAGGLSEAEANELVEVVKKAKAGPGGSTSKHRGWAIKVEMRPGVTTNGDIYVRDPSDGEVVRSIVHLKRKLGLAPPLRPGVELKHRIFKGITAVTAAVPAPDATDDTTDAADTTNDEAAGEQRPDSTGTSDPVCNEDIDPETSATAPRVLIVDGIVVEDDEAKEEECGEEEEEVVEEAEEEEEVVVVVEEELEMEEEEEVIEENKVGEEEVVAVVGRVDDDDEEDEEVAAVTAGADGEESEEEDTDVAEFDEGDDDEMDDFGFHVAGEPGSDEAGGDAGGEMDGGEAQAGAAVIVAGGGINGTRRGVASVRPKADAARAARASHQEAVARTRRAMADEATAARRVVLAERRSEDARAAATVAAEDAAEARAEARAAARRAEDAARARKAEKQHVCLVEGCGARFHDAAALKLHQGRAHERRWRSSA